MSAANANVSASGEAEVLLRPMMRGMLHLGAALLAPLGLVLLLLLADSPSAYVGASVYATGLVLLYATSATYHLLPWSGAFRGAMKRLDHSMIFVLIASTYTPFCLIVLDRAWGISMLATVWWLAGLGVALKVLWPGAPRWLGVGAYLALGWIALPAAGEIVSELDAAQTALLVAGGVLYSIGGCVYGLRRPDPLPRIFGFHEVFHALVIAGSAVHFTLVVLLIS